MSLGCRFAFHGDPSADLREGQSQEIMKGESLHDSLEMTLSLVHFKQVLRMCSLSFSTEWRLHQFESTDVSEEYRHTRGSSCMEVLVSRRTFKT